MKAKALANRIMANLPGYPYAVVLHKFVDMIDKHHHEPAFEEMEDQLAQQVVEAYFTSLEEHILTGIGYVQVAYGAGQDLEAELATWRKVLDEVAQYHTEAKDFGYAIPPIVTAAEALARVRVEVLGNRQPA